ncbi:hypothetical protein EXIGLDRAFT_838340 [Exidia glandulosa HHB12029]|uniref:Transmembrane protein n=1 Tax=Exidia glandulosa HHB12029 TaxID=1314781 RepID=A0A166A963_EXIGL|nr:hypothetical protein EXIGLDRAFT_838340 [Exidia glandulosa HHB12029]
MRIVQIATVLATRVFASPLELAEVPHGEDKRTTLHVVSSYARSEEHHNKATPIVIAVVSTASLVLLLFPMLVFCGCFSGCFWHKAIQDTIQLQRVIGQEEEGLPAYEERSQQPVADPPSYSTADRVQAPTEPEVESRVDPERVVDTSAQGSSARSLTALRLDNTDLTGTAEHASGTS